MSEPSSFEDHLERVILTAHVAQAIHQVTHSGCHDISHLTDLDRQRAEAAIDAMIAYTTPQEHQ